MNYAPVGFSREDVRALDAKESGRRGNERGRANERRLLKALLDGPLPKWIASVRLATDVEDRNGVDLVVRTFFDGTINVQVKSSKRQATVFRSRARANLGPVPIVVVVKDHEDDAILGARALWLICKERDRITSLELL